MAAFVDGVTQRVSEHVKTLTSHNLHESRLKSTTHRLSTNDELKGDAYLSFRVKLPRRGRV